MDWSSIFFYTHFALAVLASIRIIYSRRSSSAALAWLTLLYALPVFGLLLYALIGEPQLGRQRARRQADLLAFHTEFADRFLPPDTIPLCDIRFRQLSEFIKKECYFAALSGNRVQLLQNTDSMLNSMIADIHAAKHCCLLGFYIIDVEGRIEALMRALISAATRGVRCQILADSVGSKNFWESDWPQRLQKAGVEVTAALPVGIASSLWVRSDLRNHRKIMVVDYHIAYTGSYNLVDPKLFKQQSGVGEWIDAMMRCEGMVAQQLAAIFYGDWAVENDYNLKATLTQLNGYLQEMPDYIEMQQLGGDLLQTLPSQPGSDQALIYDVITAALYRAQSQIMICSPYFVPDEALLNALITAAKRGVAVKLIMPKHNDSRLVYYASRAYYQSLLDAGVEILMYQGGLLHTKTVLVDRQFALFGTANMDMRSFYLNLEVTIAVYTTDAIAQIERLLEDYLADCQPVELSKWQTRGRLQRFLERCVRLISPLL